MTRRTVIAVSLFMLGTARPAGAALSQSSRLAAVYDSILNAQFDRAAAQLKEACPPAPLEACRVLEAVSSWWRIQLDPENRAGDASFVDQATSATRAAAAWTDREPARAEAWFYLAGSYAPRVQFQVLRGERLGAARNGGRIKRALERSIQLDPGIVDAQFGIGLYEYYADVAPAAAKLLRWLFLLPGGDRVKGLQKMLHARDGGELLKGEADFQLHLIYLWYEHDPDKAIGLLKSLDARFPANPIFLERIADAYDTYVHDTRASTSALQTLIDRARSDRVYDAAATLSRAEAKLRALDAHAKLF